jgi:hypothetical protein
MDRLSRMFVVVIMIAIVFHSSLPALAAGGATVEGTVAVPCAPSRVSEVVSVRIRPVSGGAVAAVAVDPTNGNSSLKH